jgi:hypothetical protein
MPRREHLKWLNAIPAVLLTVFAPAAFGDITSLSENFDELTPQLSATSVGAFMTINGTNVDIVGDGLFGSLCVAPESGNCVDMDGTGGNPIGQLQSSSEFAAGTYLLSFDLIGSQRGVTASTTVTFGNYDKEFTLASSDTTSGIVLNQLVTLSSPGFLLFASDDPAGDEEGTLLDNVVVSPAVSSVPEPSTLLLLATLLLAIGLIARCRRTSCY